MHDDDEQRDGTALLAGHGPAAVRWAADLAEWSIPEEILATAPQSPWIHPVVLFTPSPGPIPDTPSHARARGVLAHEGSVLDVGCGGGRAALALAPPAATLIGVDHQQGMLEVFAAEAAARGLAHAEILGDWPMVADRTPVADVVVCHHVAYDIAALPAFVSALDAHAGRRVVLELPQRHPLAGMDLLWRHFWGLERPQSPTAADALAVIRELGVDARMEEWEQPSQALPDHGLGPAAQAELMRIRLCLTPDRDAEIAQVLASSPPSPRSLATIWWDVSS
jgi:SAM-dependent methyltransferase